MAFEQIAILDKPLPAMAGAKVSMTVWKHGGPRLKITLRASALADIGASILSNFDLMVGTGPDLGRIRIRRNGCGVLVAHATKNGGSATLHCGRVRQLVQAPHKPTNCTTRRVDDETLEIYLPPKMFTAPAPGAIVVDRRPAGDQTSRLMGDPPRGRSALDQARGARA